MGRGGGNFDKCIISEKRSQNFYWGHHRGSEEEQKLAARKKKDLLWKALKKLGRCEGKKRDERKRKTSSPKCSEARRESEHSGGKEKRKSRGRGARTKEAGFYFKFVEPNPWNRANAHFVVKGAW